MKRWLAFFILLLSAAPSLLAKGETTRITIAGPGLREPISVTDHALVERFNVWTGPGTGGDGAPGPEQFIADWSAPVSHVVQQHAHRYEVSFFMQFREGEAERLAYVVDYDDEAANGFVFIPGSGDPRYTLNVRTIIRDVEGQWFRATPEWTAFVRARIPRSRRRSAKASAERD